VRGDFSIRDYGSAISLRDYHGDEQVILYALADTDDEKAAGHGGMGVKSKATSRVYLQATAEGGGEIVVEDENGARVFRTK
jgi:hypothetical protein